MVQELLIIWHSRTGASQHMATAVKEGAGTSGKLIAAVDVEACDLLGAAGYVFVCPENLAALSGEMKEMFDRNYYAVLDRLGGRPFATIIAAGSDGEGAQRQIDRIATGWRLKRVVEPMIVCFHAQTKEEILAPKMVEAEILNRCKNIGLGLAEGIDLGIY